LGSLEWSRSLDAYFQRVGQGLELHQGALDRIAGASWIAHFPAGAHNALWGAHTLHGLLSTLAGDQADAGLIPLRTGLGVHLGPVLATTVGAGERLEPVLDGEGVRAAQELAGMAEQLRCGVLMSGDLAAAVSSAPGAALRPFGVMRLGPGERRIEVFDLYSVRPEATVAAMNALRDLWEPAIRHFRLGEWDEAAPLFRRYAARLPEDRPARYFLRRCRVRMSAAGPLPPPPTAG
jgi:class 3 adenylate cyclase